LRAETKSKFFEKKNDKKLGKRGKERKFEKRLQKRRKKCTGFLDSDIGVNIGNFEKVKRKR
jgi:hypothetical protein